jgi:hypothetical protein
VQLAIFPFLERLILPLAYPRLYRPFGKAKRQPVLEGVRETISPKDFVDLLLSTSVSVLCHAFTT